MPYQYRQSNGVSCVIWFALVREPNISGNRIPDFVAQSTAMDITGRSWVYLLTRFIVTLSPKHFLRKFLNINLK